MAPCQARRGKAAPPPLRIPTATSRPVRTIVTALAAVRGFAFVRVSPDGTLQRNSLPLKWWLGRESNPRTGRPSVSRRRLRARVMRLSQAHPRYGYRRITVFLRRAGVRINAKRVQRIRRREGLQVHKRQRRTRRVALSTSVRQSAQHANHVWSWDFVQDQTKNGTPLPHPHAHRRVNPRMAGRARGLEHPGGRCDHRGRGGLRALWHAGIRAPR